MWNQRNERGGGGGGFGGDVFAEGGARAGERLRGGMASDGSTSWVLFTMSWSSRGRYGVRLTR